MKIKHLLAGLFLLPLIALAGPAAADEQVTTEFDRWYVLKVSGEHAGYMHTTARRKADRYITQTDMMISIRRGNVPLDIEFNIWFIETADGKPVEASSTLKPGAAAIVNHMKFNTDHVELTTGQGNVKHTSTVPMPDPAYLPPFAAQKLIEQRIAGGDTEVSAKMLDVSMGVTPVDMSAKIIGEENVEVFGKTVPAIVWEAQISSMPGIKVREYVDSQGRPIKSSVQLMPGMDITIIEADEQLAKAKVDPPKIMAQTLIKPDKPIENARDIRSAIYQVKVKDAPDQAPIELPRTGYQRVIWDDEHTAAVVLDLDQPVNAVDDLPGEAELARSNMIDHDDPAVTALLKQALAGLAEDASDYEVATRLRAFVHEYIEAKNLSVGLATAGQVARTMQGDCTEHGVLLTALLRAKGIPSRTVTGLIYVDQFLGQQGVFGYHMWSQAWLTVDVDGEAAGGRWVDLDATLPGKNFDAAHITLSVSAMADGQMGNDLVQIVPLFGRLEIQVKEAH